MIRKLEKELPKEFTVGIAGARIKALFNTYKTTDCADFFVQETDGVLTALIGKLGGGCTLSFTDNADIIELDSFFALNKAEVFCDLDVAGRLNPKQKDVFYVARFCGDFTPPKDQKEYKISELYKKLEKGDDGNIDLPPFEYWYTDFCARFNHGAAEFAATENAVAVCGFLTESDALITGVAVDKNSRSCGEGKKVLLALVDKIKYKYPNCKIFAVSDEKVQNFYIKCGFKPSGKVAILRY